MEEGTGWQGRYVGGGSDKWWRAEAVGATYRAWWGRIGTRGQRLSKQFPCRMDAHCYLLDKAEQKMQKGYEGDWYAVGPSPVMQGEEGTVLQMVRDIPHFLEMGNDEAFRARTGSWEHDWGDLSREALYL